MYKIFGNKEENIQYTERPAVYAIIINENNEIAAVKNPYGYFLPGGGVEADESDEVCLKREMIEELGWHIEIDKFISKVGSYYFSPKYKKYHLGIGYFYSVKDYKVVSQALEDDHKLVWLTLDKVQQLFFHDHQIYAVEQHMINL